MVAKCPAWLAGAGTPWQRSPRACPRAVLRYCLCGCCVVGDDALAGYVRWVNRDRVESDSSILNADKPSGRHSAREPLEDELWLLRDLSAASASLLCRSSWRSAASARGSRSAAAMSRPPCESHCELYS